VGITALLAKTIPTTKNLVRLDHKMHLCQRSNDVGGFSRPCVPQFLMRIAAVHWVVGCSLFGNLGLGFDAQMLIML
jgi:hypothetical protein